MGPTRSLGSRLPPGRFPIGNGEFQKKSGNGEFPIQPETEIGVPPGRGPGILRA
jgi:hypothetical protein